MAGTEQFTIGAHVECTDGRCGELMRVVIDPADNEVTHLVVEHRLKEGLGRLVPIGLIAESGHKIRLDCTQKEFEDLEFAEETHFVAGEGYPGYDPGQAMFWPYYGARIGAGVSDVATGDYTVTEETLPRGEVAIRRHEPVHATDGEIGRVEGLVVDRQTHHVSHVLLQEGHLFGRKEVAIPIKAVTDVANGIHLNLSKDEVKNLPEADVERL